MYRRRERASPVGDNARKTGTLSQSGPCLLPYNLVYRTGVLYPVSRPCDMIGRGLVRKTGLIEVVVAQDHVGAYEPCA